MIYHKAVANKARLRVRRAGAVLGIVVIAMTVLLAIVGLAVDIAIVGLSCQQCQVAADAGALAGCQELPHDYVARLTAWATARANVPSESVSDFSIGTATYAEGDEIPDVGPAPRGGAIEVTASKYVKYVFLPIVGREGITVQRSATTTKVVTGACVLPIWIWHTTPVEYGHPIQLLMADAPHCGIPGSFGFLQPAGGVDFRDALRGTITPEQEELQRVHVGDTVWANTGLAIAHWRGPLKTDSNSRLKRGTWYPWSEDTFESFRADNPLILIIPMVEYIDGTGSNAHFEIIKFGAFWLEDVITQGSNRYIQGRFIEFTKPGGTGYGMKPTHLVR